MKTKTELNDEELEKIVQEFYNYFETGYYFEEFLKVYLESIGLDEVVVTQKSRDGGIDLYAKRIGIGCFSDLDNVEYSIQAKRYEPSKNIPIRYIREFRGVLETGKKGIFITTSKFSKESEQLVNDNLRPIILIDGKKLVLSCIDNELGFRFIPKFDLKLMNLLMKKDNAEFKKIDNKNVKLEIEKKITSNDVRVRILRLPTKIKELIPDNINKLDLSINNIKYSLNINGTRAYLGGVTDIFRACHLINEDNESITEGKAKWIFIDINNIQIEIIKD